MSGFKALNVESDDEIDEEPDNTKELQIEEALKIYQNALKYQSQGFSALKDTEAAYQSLFESDVFTYPESLSEYDRIQTFGEQIEDPGQAYAEPEDRIYVPAGSVENAPSTLPQVLHVAYKNRGQFHLDVLRYSLRTDVTGSGQEDRIRHRALKALDDFAAALDKDGDDVDTWRRAARVSELLGSLRTSRFCLEAIVDGDDPGTDDIIGDAGIDIKLADQDLNQVKRNVGDVVSVGPVVAKSAHLPAVWRDRLILYKDIPTAAPLRPASSEEVVITADPTWASVGEAIVKRIRVEQEEPLISSPGSCLRIAVSNAYHAPKVEKTLHAQPSDESASAVDDGALALHLDTTSIAADGQTETKNAIQSPTSTTLPTRKRSSDTAELPETPEDGRVRSKRLRARQSLAADPRDADGKTVDNEEIERKIKETTQADDWLLELLSPMLGRLGVQSTKSSKPYRQIVRNERQIGPLDTLQELRLAQAVKDFYDMMQSWDEEKSKVLSEPSQSHNTSAGAGQSGLLAFLEHSGPSSQEHAEVAYDADLDVFVADINAGWLCSTEVAMRFVLWLLCRQGEGILCQTSYIETLWSPELKQTVLSLIMTLDDLLRQQVEKALSKSDELNTETSNETSASNNTSTINHLELAQTLFELHLDLYVKVTSVTSGTDEEQRERLDKWAELARDMLCLCFQDRASSEQEPLGLFMSTRHLWTSVFQMQLVGEASREHMILCLNELKNEIGSVSVEGFKLPNNTVVPELSAAAAEKQISNLQTMDFFYGIFQKGTKSPVDLIESLEPLLDKTIGAHRDVVSDVIQGGDELTETATEPRGSDHAASQDISPTSIVLGRFFESASPSLRLLLWLRLREAYEAIDYAPKVLSINLRCIGVILAGLSSEDYLSKTTEERCTILSDAIRDLRDILNKTWDLLMRPESQFECFDMAHLQASVQATSDLWILLSAVAMFDDYSQLGGKGGSTRNPFRTYPSDVFHNASIILHDMQIQTSVLLYKLLCEAMVQAPELFPTPADDRLTYLRYVHYYFGTRRICKARDSSFLLFMKDELMLRLPEVEHQSSNDLAQVLNDLYDLHCFSSPLERQDHGCDADHLVIEDAKQLVDFVLDKASRTNVSQLLKSELGKTIEKLHTTLMWAVRVENSDAKRNAKFYQSFFRSPILPVDLYRSLKGIADISAVAVNPNDSLIASKGWFYLKGQLSLAKYKAVRAKITPGPEDDLHQANQFFLQDLEFSPERWETWLRLAQTQSYILDEKILWSAESMNNDMSGLIQTQKAAIHAFIMAIAVAMRTAELSQDISIKIAELYNEFAIFLYSATRRPFEMQAFYFDDYPEKYYSTNDLVTGRMFHPLSQSSAWKFSAVLLKKAAITFPQNWTTQYYLVKCLWKLHSRFGGGREKSRMAVIQALKRLVGMLPERKDQKQEPILDPIYKVVSIADKLVTRDEWSTEAADKFIGECLATQKQFDASRKPALSEAKSWDAHMVDILKIFRNADKPRWHHRFVVRAARIIRSQSTDAVEGATAAKEYLVDQHIYSAKTMTLSIWKPDTERPGRRFVYMTSYVLFIGQLLEETNDLEGIQLLSRRARKRAQDFADHVNLWTAIVDIHLKLHRVHASIENGRAEVIFKHIDQEEFATTAGKIDKWIQAPADESPLYEVLRETGELKKLNANLIKPSAIDDLLGDTYAAIWEHVRPLLRSEDDDGTSGEAGRVASPAPEVKAEAKDERMNMMSLTNLMNINMDGPTSSPPPPTSTLATTHAVSVSTTGLPAQSDAMPSLPAKTKPRIISRREWVKRAGEIVFQRPNTKAATPPPKTPVQTVSSGNIRVVIDAPLAGGSEREEEEGIDARRGEMTAEHEGEDEGDEEEEEDEHTHGRTNEAEEGDVDVTGLRTAPSSAPGSVHDDADDESELSELEEQEEPERVPRRQEEEGEEEEDDDDVVIVTRGFGTSAFTAALRSGETNVVEASTEKEMETD